MKVGRAEGMCSAPERLRRISYGFPQRCGCARRPV